MEISVEIVAIIAMVAVFFTVISIFAVRYALNPRNRKEQDTWLFDGWQEKVYDLLTKSDARLMAKKVGIDVSKYLRNCQLNKESPDLKRIVIDRMVGLVILAVGIMFMIVTGNPMWFAVGAIVAIPPMFLPVYTVDNKSKKRRFKVADELPRFLDLLHTALYIGMPIEQAIEVTATHLQGTILADEMLRTIADTKTGAYNWQTALARLAEDYEVDVLSDFVLDITNAYNNGSPVLDAIERQSKDIKQSNLVSMKERASRLTSTILFPILFFKIIPVLLLMCIPIIYQLTTTGFGF